MFERMKEKVERLVCLHDWRDSQKKGYETCNKCHTRRLKKPYRAGKA